MATLRPPKAAQAPLTLVAALWLVSCTTPAPPQPTPDWTRSVLAPLEQQFLDVRDIADQVDVTRSLGAERSPRGVPLQDLERQLDSARATFADALAATREDSLGTDDRNALAAMRKRVVSGFTFTASDATDSGAQPTCDYDARALARVDSGATLRARVVACYGLAARNVRVGDSTYDRLTVFGRLDREPDEARRREFFMALDTVWRSVNGDGGPSSPFRVLLPGRAAQWRAGNSPVVTTSRLLGVPADSIERWLVSVLEAWRDATAGPELEPWDFRYTAGAADRRLTDRVTLAQLSDINARYFAALGADLPALNVRFDLDPRPGKTAVAYTTFGERPRWTANGWTSGEPWIFATYTTGGFGNLGEMMHETGHAVHVAAIRTRPAFDDWPDSDTWTEAVGDLLALDAFEPAWQQHWLGDSATVRDGLRAKYSAVVLDVAWALFELRVYANPRLDPNAVWTDITQHYLHVVPHPELSWWAMRGQLIDSPGYMLNYALGAMIVADIRATLLAQRGDWTRGDPGWYADVSERLYRFGGERPARDVISDFLGRPFTPAALLSDLARMSTPLAPPLK
ncbi:MAG: hypothetical protein O2973_04770 [Gemmatimonadetes bacterium]|nr:hypothetical protein [Gemmatimonadota bacterium]